MKTVLRLLLLVLLLGLGVCGWLAWQTQQFLQGCPETPGKEVMFDVPTGARFGTIAEQLQTKGVVTDGRKFTWLARFHKQDNRLQAGRFALHTGWTPEKVLDALVNGQPVLYRITIPEGLTWWQTGKVLAEAGFVTESAFRAIVTDAEFLRHYGIPFATAEGFLMPDTYLLKQPEAAPQTAGQTDNGSQSGSTASMGTPNQTQAGKAQADLAQARRVAGRLVDNFWRKAASQWPDGNKPDAATLKRLVILASIVEKETAIDHERARVAGVYANRLEKQMLLQADPTTIYGLGPAFDGNLRRKHLDDDSNPYNTYKRAGLTPGPICSFGVQALRAAIAPEKHDFLYFVAKTDGGEHSFSTNLNEHNRAVRQYLQNRKKQK